MLLNFSRAEAWMFDFNLFYFSKTLTIDSAETGSQMFGDLAFSLELSKKNAVYLGWSYGFRSTSDASTTTTTISASEMGPKFGMFFDKDMTWGAFVTYNLVATSTYAPGGGTEQTWRGSTIKAEIGWAPQVTDNMFIGVRLNYYTATFTERIQNVTDYAQVSIPRTLMYPAFFFAYRL